MAVTKPPTRTLPIYTGGIADSSGFYFATGTPLNLDASGSSRDFFDPYIRIPVTIGDVTLMKVLSRDTIVFCEYCGTGDTFGDGYCLRCGAPYSEKLFEGYRK